MAGQDSSTKMGSLIIDVSQISKETANFLRATKTDEHTTRHFRHMHRSLGPILAPGVTIQAGNNQTRILSDDLVITLNSTALEAEVDLVYVWMAEKVY